MIHAAALGLAPQGMEQPPRPTAHYGKHFWQGRFPAWMASCRLR